MHAGFQFCVQQLFSCTIRWVPASISCIFDIFKSPGIAKRILPKADPGFLQQSRLNWLRCYRFPTRGLRDGHAARAESNQQLMYTSGDAGKTSASKLVKGMSIESHSIDWI